jgi:hypothetical protein
MRWDHFTTLRRALWIGGGQWAGKSTVAGILADRFGLTHYHYDYHDSRGHWDRRTARWCREGSRPPDPRDWMTLTVPEAVAGSLASFVERFEFVQDDLRALQSPRPILAEGWGLRPELVAPVTSSIGRMVVLVPAEEFRQTQMTRLARAAALARPADAYSRPAGVASRPVADPEAAQRRRVERDRLIADDAVRNARRLGVRVIEVDGSRDANGMADIVADHFSVFL